MQERENLRLVGRQEKGGKGEEGEGGSEGGEGGSRRGGWSCIHGGITL